MSSSSSGSSAASGESKDKTGGGSPSPVVPDAQDDSGLRRGANGTANKAIDVSGEDAVVNNNSGKGTGSGAGAGDETAPETTGTSPIGSPDKA